MSANFWENLRSLRRIFGMSWSYSSKCFLTGIEPSFLRRSSSMAKPLIVQDTMMTVSSAALRETAFSHHAWETPIANRSALSRPQHLPPEPSERGSAKMDARSGAVSQRSGEVAAAGGPLGAAATSGGGVIQSLAHWRNLISGSLLSCYCPIESDGRVVDPD